MRESVVVEYTPSGNIHEYGKWEEGRRFVKRYVLPLGRPRKNVLLSDDEVVIQFDRAGALGAIPTFIELAAGSLSTMEWEEVEESPTGWWGDLEPGSPILYMEQDGPKLELRGGFRYAPLPYKHEAAPPAEPGTAFSLAVESQGSGRPFVVLSGNGAAFLTFAKRAVYLSQPGVPVGSRIGHRGSDSSLASPRQIALELAPFSPDVPWGVPPVVGHSDHETS